MKITQTEIKNEHKMIKDSRILLKVFLLLFKYNGIDTLNTKEKKVEKQPRILKCFQFRPITKVKRKNYPNINKNYKIEVPRPKPSS